MSEENPYEDRDCESADGVPEKQKNETSNNANPEQKSADAPLAVMPPEPNQSPTNGKQCKKRYKCIKEEIKYWFEIAGLIAGLAVLYLLWKQYGEMAKTTKVAISQLQAMQGQFQAMINQAAIMQGQLEEMKRTRNLDERAWIALSDIHNATVNGEVYFTVQYKNTGRTPAINVQQAFGITDVLTNITTTDPRQKAASISALIAPSGTGEMNSQDTPFPAFYVQGLINAKHDIFLYGTIWYDDIFGNHHWTQFGFRVSGEINGGVAYSPLSIHNCCDSTQTNQTN